MAGISNPHINPSGCEGPRQDDIAAACCKVMLTDCPLSPQRHTRWDWVWAEWVRHGGVLCHVEEHGRTDRGRCDPPEGAPGGQGQGVRLPRSETCGWQRLPGGQVRSRVEAGLVSSSAAFLLGEQCMVLSQQRCFKSGCLSYPTNGVEPDHSLLMKLPFCCCCCLFCEQNVGGNLPVFSRGLLLYGW